MTPEAKVKLIIKRVLDYHKTSVYYYMPVPGGYGATTLDYLGAIHGRAFAIEAKAPGKKPLSRQERVIEEMQSAGMKVFIIDGEEGAAELRAWLGDADRVRTWVACG